MAAKSNVRPLKNDLSHLKNGRINLHILREYIVQQIKRCFDQFQSEKFGSQKFFSKDRCIVIDDDIKNVLLHLQALNELNSNDLRIFRERQHDTSDYRVTIFLIRPRLVYMEIIANMIKDELNKLSQQRPKEKFFKQYAIVFVPRHSRVCEEKLKEKNVRGDVVFDELNLDFLPIDTDLISMELKDSFRDIYLNDDKTTIINLAHGLINFQKLYGIIPNVYVKGDKAKQCYENMTRMQREVPSSEQKVQTQIDNLFLIDRSIDYITPMMVPATYEALIDEVFGLIINYKRERIDIFRNFFFVFYLSGIQFNRIEVPTRILSKDFCDDQNIDQSSLEKVGIQLLSVDWLYNETRHLHMAYVGKVFQEGARAKIDLKKHFDDQFSGPASELRGDRLVEMRDFVKRINEERMKTLTLSTHLELALYVKKQMTHIYDMYLANQLTVLFNPVVGEILKILHERIAWKDDIYCVIRYLAIATQAAGAQIKRKDYDSIKRDILQTYGFQYIVLFHALEQVGIISLTEQTKTSTLSRSVESQFERIKREFRLLQEDGEPNLIEPQDLFYVYYQYAPLTIRFVERIVFRTANNAQCQEVLSILPGAIMIDTQQIPMDLKRQRRSSVNSINSTSKAARATGPQNQNSPSSAPESKTSLVVFVGGITYGEIAALKYLSGENHDFIIATTHFINGKSFMKSLLETQILPL